VSATTYRLYGYWRSSSSYRVRIGLGLKGLAYDYVAVHLLEGGGQHKRPEFAAKNAMRQVPVLEIEQGDAEPIRLVQSVAILEYLDETVATPRLLPADALARAHVRAAVEIVNSGTQPLQNLALLQELKAHGADGQAFAKAANERGLAALEAIAREHGRGYLVGSELSLAEVFLVPQLYSARRFGVDVAAFPRLVEIEARCAALDAFAAAHPDRQPDAVPA
jgi:maleylpyruvate isomerase